MKKLITKLLNDLEKIGQKQEKEKNKYMKHFYEGEKSYISQLLAYMNYQEEL